ncbi:MAG: hypothetical protein GX606_00935, partial [Elusimicrobia bacterium]|nr:hypothetical protein [Elusimicrobiota bacterium]
AVLPTIEKMRNEVVKEGCLAKMAQRFHLPEAVLHAMRGRLLSRQPERAAVEIRETILREARTPMDEKTLLRLLLVEPRWVGLARQNLDLQDLRDRKVRMVVERIYEFFEAERAIDPAALVSSFEDEDVQSFVTACSQDDGVLTGDRERIFDDCLKRIHSSRERQQRQRIMTEMQAAEEKGDWETVRRLQEDFNTLIKK